jgi:3-deoxy-D-manno-octulosonate 8-phosphate phosphatase (KDO 8-P phosphatase)
VKSLSASVRKRAEKIRLLLLDVDGVLTDGGIIFDNRGGEIKRFCVRDGQGIVLLIRYGIAVGFITSRRSDIVRRRAKELGVQLVHQAVQDKLNAYRRIKRKSRLADEEIAYVGDDIADLPVMRRVGLAIAVHDSAAELKPVVDYVTNANGGSGAVREVTELLLKAHGIWEKLLASDFQ